MQQELKTKLEKVIELVNNVLVDPDIDIDYYIPENIEKIDMHDTHTLAPYVLLKYAINETHIQEQKILIKHNYLSKTPEDLANLITFFIEQFIEQISSVQTGPQ
jgi:hypothetical protein